MSVSAIATSVIGCYICGKPAALVGDELPAKECPWCLAQARPGVFDLYIKETPRSDADAARLVWLERGAELLKSPNATTREVDAWVDDEPKGGA